MECPVPGPYEDARYYNAGPIRGADAAQVVLSQRDHEVQTFPPQRADEPFAEGIGLRTLRRRFEDLSPR